MSPARKATSARSGASSKTRKSTAKKTPVKKTAAKTSARKAATQKAGAKKPAAKKATTKKAASQKTGAKKAASQTGAKKTASQKTGAKKAPSQTGAKKAASQKTGAKRPTAKKLPKKPVPQKTVAAKPAIKKPVSRPTPPAPPKKKVRAAKLDKAQLEKIRANLVEKQVELETRKKELDEASFTSTQSDITGEVGLDEDFADAGTATFERERDLSIRNNIRDLIDQVTRAMQRIDEGTYGTCERCGQPIDATRLRELPHASLCLDCKRREERAR